MTSLAALVAGLASGVERSTVGRGAIARNVAKLAAGVALHGLSLAVARKVVRSSTLVAGCGARTAGEAASCKATVSAAGNWSTTTQANTSWGRAGSLET